MVTTKMLERLIATEDFLAVVFIDEDDEEIGRKIVDGIEKQILNDLDEIGIGVVKTDQDVSGGS